MIPAWLLERQEPVEISEKKNYVLANLRTVAKMLLYFSQSGPDYEAKGLPCVRLFELVVMIICILLSNTVLFLEIMLVIVMLRLVLGILFVYLGCFFVLGDKLGEIFD